MRFTRLAHPIPLDLIILIPVLEDQKSRKFSGYDGSRWSVDGFFCVYTPCGKCVLWCFGGKPASVFRVAVWIAWMLKWLEKGVCQSYGKARGNLALFRPLQQPRDSDCHPEGGGSTFLRNFRIHKYHKAYKSARRPPNKKNPWTSTLWNFLHPPVISCLFGLDILLSTVLKCTNIFRL